MVIQPLSTRLIKPNFCFHLSHRRSTTVSLETRNLEESLRGRLPTGSCYMFPYLRFGIPLLITLFWLNLVFEEKLSLVNRVGVSLSIIPPWATPTSSWLFVLITNPMKDCFSRCHAEIRTAADIKHFPSSEKTWATINVLDRNKSNKKELLI